MNMYRRQLSHYISLFALIFISALTPTTAQATPAAQSPTNEPGLVLWNGLGSQAEIEDSFVGLDGSYLGGQFTSGKVGGAYIVNYNENELVRFPYQVVPTEEGTIEFWAKLTNVPAVLRWGENPSLIKIVDSAGTGFGVHLNGNDGAGGGGLCGRASFRYTACTGRYGTWTYAQVLGDVNAWHHYALVWSKTGLLGNSQLHTALYLDGQFNSTYWYTGGGAGFIPLLDGELVLNFNQHLSQGTITFDELKIWDYAKREFDLTSADPNDLDGDGIVNTADNCVNVSNPDQSDADGDSFGNACDSDDDADGAQDQADNCPLLYNPTQDDADGDGMGNHCDDDDDNDGLLDTVDNCLVVFNPDQLDTDADGLGNFCDTDDDNDGAEDTIDNCLLEFNPTQDDIDGDTMGNACDSDDDADSVEDIIDNCPLYYNPTQTDMDGDGMGDQCDLDDDNDGVIDDLDNCTWTSNPAQLDTDVDGWGNVCDGDDDNDGAEDPVDNCPIDFNPTQDDTDGDGIGDLCDPV